MIETIYAAVSGDPDVVGVVGSDVYNSAAPDATQEPLVIIQHISTQSYNQLFSGPQARNETYQLDAYSKSAVEANTLGEYLRLVMIDFGQMESLRTDYDETTQVWRVSMDFAVISEY